MQLNIILLIVGLQLFIVAIAFVALRFAARKGIIKPAMSGTPEADQESLLDREIGRTRETLSTPPGDIENIEEILKTRLSYLHAERRALISSRDKPGHFWQRLTEELAALAPPATQDEPESEPEPAPQATEPSPVVAETHEAQKDSEKEMLRDLVETYESRVETLELYRDQFFELKEQMEGMQEKYDALQDELDRILPQSERTEELEAINASLKADKDSLQKKLQTLASMESNDSGKASKKTQPTMGQLAMQRSETIEREMAALDDHASEQESILKELRAQSEKVSNSSEEMLGFVKQIETLENKLQSIRDESQTLRHENQKLQRELENALGTTKSKDEALEDYRETVDDLKTMVVEQKERIRELNEEMGALATQAQEAEKLQAMIKEFTAKNAEMLMCVYTLEDENDFLRKQIGELLKENQGNAGAEADITAAPAADVAPLQEKISGLEEELQKKTDAYTKLQKKFASMEKEYLSMYEEMHKKKK